MCIYYGNSSALTYKKQEHVFPAGLGGKIKLPYGCVSDQANEFFSPMELQLMRHSLIAFDRMMFGPGDRGTLQPSKASKSPVNVGVQDDGQIVLCYTALGKPYNIPQVHIGSNSATVTLPNEQANAIEYLNYIINALHKFNGRFVFLRYKELPAEDVIIGFFENHYYVTVAGDRPEIEYVQNKIHVFLRNFRDEEFHSGEHRVTQHHSIQENPSIARMYAKVAMNTLALLKGADYVTHSNFDKIRTWILTGDFQEDFLFLPSILTDKTDDLIKVFPASSHWCIFSRMGNTVEAMICFYNRYMRRFTFGDLINSTDFIYPNGFVCDWKNEKEYTLEEYISKLTLDAAIDRSNI